MFPHQRYSIASAGQHVSRHIHVLYRLAFCLMTVGKLTLAQTLLSGDIGGTTFDPTGNPYIVEKDIIVQAGQKTVIKSGCVFLFQPFTGVTVNGALKIDGTEEAPVIFTSTNDSIYNKEATLLPNPFDWNGVRITANAGDATITSLVLQYSVYGIKSEKNDIIITASRFHQNGQFHFTVRDKIQHVADNIPYSYSLFDVKPATENRPEPDPAIATPPDNHGNTHVILRILSGVITVGGIGGGVYFDNIMKQNKREKLISREQYLNAGGTISATSYQMQVQPYRDTMEDSFLYRNISCVLAGLGAIGFTLTFIF